MFALRRAAARAITAPSKSLFTQKPRSITTFTPIAFRSRQQQWSVPALQRRFVSDETVKSEKDRATEEKIAEDKAVESAPEEFAQTATEAPVDEDVTPVKEATPIEGTATPVDAESTLSGASALGAAAGFAAGGEQRERRRFNVPAAPPSQELYVGNLFFQVTEDQLHRVFSRFGAVEQVKLIKDPTGRPRGFGYVRFENQADATAAMENLDMQVFEGRNMVVQYTRGKKEPLSRTGGFQRPSAPPSKTLYIGNMSFEMTDKDLNDLFKNVRNVLDVRVAIDRRTGQPRGFAHADFLDIASAEKAKAQLENQVLYGRKLRIDFGKSTREAAVEKN